MDDKNSVTGNMQDNVLLSQKLYKGVQTQIGFS